ncbi:hypothetical protein [Puia sp.]|jgi:hypothetical protein|uniref:hypothetical protein n=1 Tax=Puia sp. TaxID=2045100 RepID=UPI002F4074A9
MKKVRNKYIGLIIILLAVTAAGFFRAHNGTATPPPKLVRSTPVPKFRDAVIAARYHQNHFKRHRFHFNGLLPVTQDTMIPIVTGAYPVAQVQVQSFSTPSTARLRGPPAA